MSLLAIKATTDANTAEQKRLQDRRRNLLILINQYLIESGYIETAERFQTETNGITNKYTPADNVDLLSILIDYESYYEIRFDKKPKVVRKLGEGEESVLPNKLRSQAANASKKQKKQTESTDSGTTKLPSINNTSNNNINTPETDTGKSSDFSITGTTITTKSNSTNNNNENHNRTEIEEKILKPPPNFFGDSELKQLANVISREIYQESPNIRFQDIVHLEEAKRLLMEAIHLPIRFPTLFTGILRPWRGILLHGPPGTGKTLLAKAVATECNTTFFNISASTLISKWRGDSEKLVRVLFELARYHAPSTIFLDEIDSILTSRDGSDHGGGEHEASRRMKTELLIQLDGMNNASNSAGKSSQVFVMAASNLPWELDVALLRRLEKRVLVSLPTFEAREMMLRKHLSDRASPDLNYSEIAQRTEGYSGADLELVCRESAMMPVRRLICKIDQIGAEGSGDSFGALNRIPDPPAPTGVRGNPSIKKTTLPPKNLAATQLEIDALLKTDPVTTADLLNALNSTKPSSDGKISK